MSKKTFELVNSIIGGVATIATGIVVYFVDATASAGISAGIVALITIISDIMAAFIKEI